MSKQETPTISHHSKIGLALGSGSARGLAHLGVLRAIEENNLKIDFIAGTSIGALVGAIYAAGNLAMLEASFKSFGWKSIVSLLDPVIPKTGLIDGRKIMEFVQAHLPISTFEALPIPLQIVTTDILTGKEIVIREGNLLHAIRASIAVPGIFTPVSDKEHALVDGGLVNPVPVNVVRAMGADFVIAVDLNYEKIKNQKIGLATSSELAPKNHLAYHATISQTTTNYPSSLERIKQILINQDQSALRRLRKWLEPEPLPSIFEILVASINIMGAKISENQLKIDRPELIIRPPLGDVHFLAFDQVNRIIATGHDTAHHALATINYK